MADNSEPGGENRGPGSFCIPRPVIDALLREQATALEICAFLTLACFTEEGGVFTPASVKAINTYTGANKAKIERALIRLKAMRVVHITKVSNGRSGKSLAWIEQTSDQGPILVDRETWLASGKEVPDGPVERSKTLYILPDFGVPLADRVWFGNNLVRGVGGFDMPLKALKNAGDTAARLLLLMFAATDMENWGGVTPIGPLAGPWEHYEPVAADQSAYGLRIIRAKNHGPVGPGDTFKLAWPTDKNDFWAAHGEAGGPVWAALKALRSSGLVYEVVMVLNRNAIKKKFTSGTEYSDIPDDAEPLYELDCRSAHGYKPKGEEGLGWATAKTASDLGASVALPGGHFDGTYAAIVQDGFPAMIVGIYRPRFRVSNPKNAGVKGAWARIFQNTRDAFELIQKVRERLGLPLLKTPGQEIHEGIAEEKLSAV